MAEEKESPKEKEAPKEERPLEAFTDVSLELFKLCEGLEVGELVTAKQFKMSEVMSAIELMEPKMDVGVGSRHIKTVDIASEQGLFSDDLPLQLAILDATIAMTVAWLEGSSLGSTVWTNIMLVNLRSIRHPIFHPFCAGINLLVRNIHSLCSNVGNIEELPEDFNPQGLFMQTIRYPRVEVCQMLRDQMSVLGQLAKNYSKSPRAEILCKAIAARFEFVALLLEMMGILIPPEIEDPQWGRPRFPTDDPDEADEELSDEQKESIKNDVLAKEVVQKMVEEFGAKVAMDGVEQGVKKAAAVQKSQEEPENKPPQKCCSSDTHYHDEMGEETDSEEEIDGEETVQFKPNFQFANVISARLIALTRFIADTVIYGRRGPDDKDGDFSWLQPFEPKACIKLIPATFPRSVKFPTRKEAADWWRGCATRLNELIALAPQSAKDLNTLFFFAKRFSLTSCVFTRSLLQVCMFPVDMHILGDDQRTIRDPIEISLKKCYMPQVLDEESPVFKDEHARRLYNIFIVHMTRLAINMYGSFGCNLSRQRDRLEISIEELSTLQYHAGQLEARTDEVLVEGGHIPKKEDNFAYQGTITFVFHNLLAVSHQYFELGFRMDLYVPYEFTYIYWFLGTLQAHWMAVTMNRSKEIQMNWWKSHPIAKTTDPGQLRQRHQLEEEIRARLATHAVNVMVQFSFMKLCQGILKASVYLIRKGLVRMPPGGEEAERLRFERRFEPYQNLGCPLSCEYEDFKATSGMDMMREMPLDQLIDSARNDFNEGYTKLQAVDNSREQNEEASVLIRVNKGNLCACSLLKAMDLSDRSVEWVFEENFPMYPTLKIKQLPKKAGEAPATPEPKKTATAAAPAPAAPTPAAAPPASQAPTTKQAPKAKQGSAPAAPKQAPAPAAATAPTSSTTTKKNKNKKKK